ncbi:MAG: nucleoside triphosphate pyrophosphohydrolase [Ignavibacteria bacterium]|nr:nucleoside triphosphate pyrophosphohydrolase [Ignavibacteria bacterium]
MKEFDKLVEIVRKLRKECPWDKEQTHQTLRRCLLEESYEVLEAIDTNNLEELKKELGDLILQAVFHSAIAEESSEFTLKEVLEEETNKLIARHPHIFGNVKVSGSEEVKKNWEAIKKKEGRKSILDGVPKELPALFRAYRIQEKASKVGFDWGDIEPVFEKIQEEVNELKTVLQEKEKNQDTDYQITEKLEDEFGDVLFTLVNYARFLKINPEDALRKTIEKFIYRFNEIEKYAEENNLDLNNISLEEMDKIWNRTKSL